VNWHKRTSVEWRTGPFVVFRDPYIEKKSCEQFGKQAAACQFRQNIAFNETAGGAGLISEKMR